MVGGAAQVADFARSGAGRLLRDGRVQVIGLALRRQFLVALGLVRLVGDRLAFGDEVQSQAGPNHDEGEQEDGEGNQLDAAHLARAGGQGLAFRGAGARHARQVAGGPLFS